MISDQELQAAVVSIEQYIKDCEVSKEKDKHATDRLTKWSVLIADSKTKLQVLHYAMGLTSRMTETDIKKGYDELNALLETLHQPQEIDLFKNDDGKELSKMQRIMEIKKFTLQFVLGLEKKIV